MKGTIVSTITIQILSKPNINLNHFLTAVDILFGLPFKSRIMYLMNECNPARNNLCVFQFA